MQAPPSPKARTIRSRPKQWRRRQLPPALMPTFNSINCGQTSGYNPGMAAARTACLRRNGVSRGRLTGAWASSERQQGGHKRRWLPCCCEAAGYAPKSLSHPRALLATFAILLALRVRVHRASSLRRAVAGGRVQPVVSGRRPALRLPVARRRAHDAGRGAGRIARPTCHRRILPRTDPSCSR